MFKDFVSGFVGWVGMAVIVLIFTFLFLFQREKYEAFFVQVSGGDTHPDEARKLIGRIATVAQSYLTGRVLSILIFTVLFTAGFLIVGLESAFLLAFIAALLTIIPYVGSIIGGLFPFAVALVTEDSTNAAIGALAVVIIIQGIDNYFIEPYIIGGEVNISAFFTILILLVGGLLWGVAGMILFLPMLGVAKIIFDAVPSLKAYGYLVGDQEQEKASGRIWKKLKRLFGKEKGGNGDSHPKNGNGRSQA
jgi:predicted PurR-regulated permease PerM